MNDESVKLVVHGLLEVRRQHRAYSGGAIPQSLDQAYRVQDSLVTALDEEVIGWKIGCTSKMAQEMSSTDEPFYGRMLTSTTYSTPGSVEFSSFFAPIVEPEIAFRFNADLIPKNSPFGVNDIIESVDAIFPAIEIVDCRYAEGWPIGILPTVSDNGVHAAFIFGPETSDWRQVDRPNVPVKAEVNGEFVTDGVGANALDDPLNALVWLANACSKRGHSIRAGEIVTTGNTVTKAIFAEPGDGVVATFGGLGEVRVSFER